MAYLGNTPTTQSFISGTDYFNGDGATTAFTLTRTVNSVNDIEAVINNVVQQPNTAYTLSGTTITFTSAPSAGTGNIYVRYLSTTTQSITPSQNTVSWNTLNTNTQSALGMSFKNRIINGAMMIDQRNSGSSVTPADGAYTLDRWAAIMTTSGKFTVQQNAGGVTPPAGFTNYLGITSSSSYSVGTNDLFGIQQRIEGLNFSDLNWGSNNAKSVTLSFWVYSSITGTFGGGLNNSAANRCYPFSYSISAGNTWTQVSITVPGDTTGTWLTTNGIGLQVNFGVGAGSTYSGTAGAWTSSAKYTATGATSVVGTNGATFYITGIQLEIGSQATNFDNRSIGTEYQLCQRYYYKQYNGVNYPRFANGFTSSSAVAFQTIQHPVIMRTAPTSVTTTGNLCIWYGAGNLFAISAISIETVSTGITSTTLQCTVSGAGSTVACQLMANNDGTATVAVSAEL